MARGLNWVLVLVRAVDGVWLPGCRVRWDVRAKRYYNQIEIAPAGGGER